MASEDKPKPKLPPPPIVGEMGASSGSKFAPPELSESKAKARQAGIDTSFIDGLTSGLLDEIPGADEDPPSPARSAKAATDDEETEAEALEAEPLDGEDEKDVEDDLEHQPTRALPAMDEDGEVASPRDEPPAEDDAPPAQERPEAAAGEMRSPSSAPVASAIPRSWLMAGAAAGLMSLAVLWKVCGGGDASSTSGDAGDRLAALERAEDAGDPEDGGEGGNSAGNVGDEGAGGGGHDRADGAADDGAGGAAAETDASSARDEDQSEAKDDTGDDVLEIEADVEAAEDDEDTGSEAGRSGGSTRSALPPGGQSAERAAEDEMSAEELLRAAKEAYAKGKARDAYRLANLSNQKQKSDEALVLKAKAACKMKNKDLAKSAFKNLPLGEKRRDVRQTCRESDVRLGL